jgi:hypothetical protein
LSLKVVLGFSFLQAHLRGMMTLFPFKEMCIADTDKFTAVTRNRKKENIATQSKKSLCADLNWPREVRE